MTCYYPLHGWKTREYTEKGSKTFTTDHKLGDHDLPQTIPCGQCTGCRLEHARKWAVRCHHEASLYDDNCFITLTYNSDHLPDNNSLSLLDFQLFMKRLRKKFSDRKIRFFHCGEYGEKTFRPHYHALLFNIDFPDKKHYQTNNEHRLYKSEILDDLWSHPITKCYMGDALIGNLTFDSASYCARYVLKKITGPLSYDYYDGLTPEYATMSRRPGIGSKWMQQFHSDIYPEDHLVINGVKTQSIPFYDKQYLKIINELPPPSLSQLPERIKTLKIGLTDIKIKRIANAKENLDNNTDWRLRTREQVKLSQIKQLTRG